MPHSPGPKELQTRALRETKVVRREAVAKTETKAAKAQKLAAKIGAIPAAKVADNPTPSPIERKADRMNKLKTAKDLKKPRSAAGKATGKPPAKASPKAGRRERRAQRPATPPAKPAKPAPAPKAKKPEADGAVKKIDIVRGLLTRPGGCTSAQALAATQWPAISMPQAARQLGLTLKKDKQPGKPTVYSA